MVVKWRHSYKSLGMTPPPPLRPASCPPTVIGFESGLNVTFKIAQTIEGGCECGPHYMDSFLTWFLSYPSGNIAVLITATEKGKFTYLVYGVSILT